MGPGPLCELWRIAADTGRRLTGAGSQLKREMEEGSSGAFRPLRLARARVVC